MDIQDSTLSASGAGQGDKGFGKIELLLEATGGLSLSQVCIVTGLEPSTIQNWVKRGWVAHPIGKRYEEVHIARILIINALKECIKLEHISKLMTYLNGNAKDGSSAIIRESVLYNYLCEATRRSGQKGDSSKGGVENIVDDVIKDFESANTDDRIKLRKVLTLMMFACVCTDVKRRTEAMMGQILGELANPGLAGSKPETVETPKITPIDLPIPKPSKSAARAPKAASAAAAQKPSSPAKPAATASAAEAILASITAAPTPVAPATPVTPKAPEPPAEAAAPAAAIEPAIPAVNKSTSIPQSVTPIRITLDDPEEPEDLVSEISQTRKTISQALREWDISSVEKIIIDHDAEARSNVEAETEKEELKKPVNRPWYIKKSK